MTPPQPNHPATTPAPDRWAEDDRQEVFYKGIQGVLVNGGSEAPLEHYEGQTGRNTERS